MKEWLEGREAYRLSLPISDNPYRHGTWSYFQWVDGWRTDRLDRRN